MTVTITTTRETFTGDDTTTSLAIPFVFITSSDLIVTSRIIATAVDTLLVEGTHYTVAGGGTPPATGTITVTDPATDFATGVQWIVRRSLPETQTTDLINNADFDAETLETQLDRETLKAQETRDFVAQAIHFPADDPLSLTTELPSSKDRAGKVVSFDSSGNVTTLSQLDQSANTVTPTGGTALRSHAAIASDWKNVLSYGATADTVTDDSAAIQAAIDDLPPAGGVVFFPPGTYRIATQLNILVSGTWLLGSGTTSTTLFLDSTTMNGIKIGDGATTVQETLITNMRVKPADAQTQTAGAMIAAEGDGVGGTIATVRLIDLQFDQPFVAVDFLDVGTWWIERCEYLNTTTTGAGVIGFLIRDSGNAVAQNGIINNCLITGDVSKGIGAQPAAGIRFTGKTIQHKIQGTQVIGCGVGLDIGAGSSSVQISDCAFDQNSDDNVRIITTADTDAGRIGDISLRSSWLGNDPSSASPRNHGLHVDLGAAGKILSLEVSRCEIVLNGKHGIFIESSGGTINQGMIQGNGIAVNGQDTNNTWDGIRGGAGVGNLVIGNNSIGRWFNGTARQKYGINMLAGAGDNYTIQGNDLRSNATAGLIDSAAGASAIIRNNAGWITENSGTSTLANGGTTKVQAHGLSAAPTVVQITPIETLASASFFFVNTIGGTNFTINVNTDPGADVDFHWEAKVR